MGHPNPLYSILSAKSDFKSLIINKLTDRHGDAYQTITIEGEPKELRIGNDTYAITDKHFTFYQQLSPQKGPVHFTLTLNGDHQKKIRVFFDESFTIVKIQSGDIALDELATSHLKNMIEPHVNATLSQLQKELQKKLDESDSKLKNLLENCDTKSQIAEINYSTESINDYIRSLTTAALFIEEVQEKFNPKFEAGTLQVLQQIIRFLKVNSVKVLDDESIATSSAEPTVQPALQLGRKDTSVQVDDEASKYNDQKKIIDELEKINHKTLNDWICLHKAHINLIYTIPQSNVQLLNNVLNKIIGTKKSILKFWQINFIFKKDTNISEAKCIIDYVGFSPTHLYLAIKNGSNVAELIVSHFKININIVTIDGLGFLEYAANKYDLAVFKWLLNNGANPLTVDKNGDLLVKILPSPYKNLLLEKIATKLSPEDLSYFFKRFSPESRKDYHNILTGENSKEYASLIGSIVANPHALNTLKTNDVNKSLSVVKYQMILNAGTQALIEASKEEYKKRGEVFGSSQENEVRRVATEQFNKKFGAAFKMN